MKWCGRIGRQLALSLVVTSTATAQTRTAVVGLIRDSSGAPVAQAHIASSGVRTISDSAGRFTMENLPTGRVALSVRRLGFEPADLFVQLFAGRRDSLIVVLTVLPVDLPGVITNVDAARGGRLAEFYRHRENGMGKYLDRKQLDAMRVSLTSDVLRRLPGVRLVPDRNGRYVLRMGRSGGRNCPPDFWVDGIRAQFLNIDDLPLSDVEALEVYSGPGALPPEYNNRFGNPACGAVVIWTRVPG